MSPRVLCVAEKPAIAKSVAQHLSGGSLRVVSSNSNSTWRHILIAFDQRNSRNRYVKNYDFDFTFPAWGRCSVTMTSVLGHLTQLDFEPQFKGWHSCAPGRLYEVGVVNSVADVSRPLPGYT